MLDQYRIHRTDGNNIAIQKKQGKRWRTVSYHGNSLRSLVSGVSDLIGRGILPGDEGLLEQLKDVEIELWRLRLNIKRVLERMIDDD